MYLSNELKSKACAISSIDEGLLSDAGLPDAVSRIIMNDVEVVRNLKASLSFTCLSGHGSTILMSPCKNLFVQNLKTDADGMVVGFDLTCDPSKAVRFTQKWADMYHKSFKNGQGHFTPIYDKDACVASIERLIDSVKLMVNKLIKSDNSTVNSFEQIQGDYMGDFYKIDNSGLL